MYIIDSPYNATFTRLLKKAQSASPVQKALLFAKEYMNKIIFILLDGLSAASSVENMPFLAQAHKSGKAWSGTLTTEVPPLSRPIYATLFTGLSPQQTGIVRNEAWQLPSTALQQSFFRKMHCAGFTCAAAAYHWMYELYMGEIFSPAQHRMYFSAHEKCLQHGIFYSEDVYPDSHVFQDAVFLYKQYNPDFLLIHTMNIDDAGHKYGGKSVEYAQAVCHADALLAAHVPVWLEQGSTVVVLSDHGMDGTGNHVHMSPEVSQVPYAIFFPPQVQNKQNHLPIQSQKDWYAWLCAQFAL